MSNENVLADNSVTGDGVFAVDTVSVSCAEDYVGSIPSGTIDLTVTSPPYGDLRNYNGFSFDVDVIAESLFDATVDGGIVVWVVSDKTKNGSESGDSFRQALSFMEHGFSLYDTMIYAKSNPIPLTHRRYEQTFEYMFVFCKGRKPKTFNPIMVPKTTDATPGKFRQRSDGVLESAHSGASNVDVKIKGNIWYYSVGNGKSSKDKRAFKHPATFPEALARDHIISWSDPGDVVLDPFLGSGTTAVMAIRFGRHFCGCDSSAEYIDEIAVPRIKDELSARSSE